jgi:hypothetical protein
MSSESESSQNEFIPVNQVLNLKPRLGPIPGEQVFPWAVIALVSYLICQGLLGLSWIATGLVAGWGIATWWALTGDESWRFLSKFRGVPDWTMGNLQYTSLLERQTRKARRTTQARRRKYAQAQRRRQR